MVVCLFVCRCATYIQAQPGDYLSKIADAAVIRVGQLLLDNNSTLRDLNKPLSGTQLLLCNPDPASVSTGTPKPAAAASSASAGVSPAPAAAPAATPAAPIVEPSAAAAPAVSVPPPAQAMPSQATVFPTKAPVTSASEEAAGVLVCVCVVGTPTPQHFGHECLLFVTCNLQLPLTQWLATAVLFALFVALVSHQQLYLLSRQHCS